MQLFFVFVYLVHEVRHSSGFSPTLACFSLVVCEGAFCQVEALEVDLLMGEPKPFTCFWATVDLASLTDLLLQSTASYPVVAMRTDTAS